MYLNTAREIWQVSAPKCTRELCLWILLYVTHCRIQPMIASTLQRRATMDCTKFLQEDSLVSEIAHLPQTTSLCLKVKSPNRCNEEDPDVQQLLRWIESRLSSTFRKLLSGYGRIVTWTWLHYGLLLWLTYAPLTWLIACGQSDYRAVKPNHFSSMVDGSLLSASKTFWLCRKFPR